MNLMKFDSNVMMSSLELTEKINEFRAKEGVKMVIEHKTVLKKIRRREAVIKALGGEGKFSPSYYTSAQNKKVPMIMIPASTANMIAAQESILVSVLLEDYIDTLEAALVSKNETIANEAVAAVELTVEQLNLQVDHLIKTKGEINSSKTATAMNTASQKSKGMEVAYAALNNLAQMDLLDAIENAEQEQ